MLILQNKKKMQNKFDNKFKLKLNFRQFSKKRLKVKVKKWRGFSISRYRHGNTTFFNYRNKMYKRTKADSHMFVNKFSFGSGLSSFSTMNTKIGRLYYVASSFFYLYNKSVMHSTLLTNESTHYMDAKANPGIVGLCSLVLLLGISVVMDCSFLTTVYCLEPDAAAAGEATSTASSSGFGTVKGGGRSFIDYNVRNGRIAPRLDVHAEPWARLLGQAHGIILEVRNPIKIESLLRDWINNGGGISWSKGAATGKCTDPRFLNLDEFIQLYRHPPVGVYSHYVRQSLLSSMLDEYMSRHILNTYEYSMYKGDMELGAKRLCFEYDKDKFIVPRPRKFERESED